MSIDKNDIFKVLISCLLALVVWISNGVLTEQKDIQCRIRIVELNQARIMERLGVEPVSLDQANIRHLSKSVDI